MRFTAPSKTLLSANFIPITNYNCNSKVLKPCYKAALNIAFVHKIGPGKVRVQFSDKLKNFLQLMMKFAIQQKSNIFGGGQFFCLFSLFEEENLQKLKLTRSLDSKVFWM